MGIEGYYEDYFDERNMKSQTNYDRIHNMSVDEMAEFMAKAQIFYETQRKVLQESIVNKYSFEQETDAIMNEYKQWLLVESEG